MLTRQKYITFIFSSGVTCDVPVAGTDTTLETTNTVYYYLERANFSCNNPAAMVTQGSLSLQCEAKGGWSDSPPVCGEYLIKD